MNLQMFRFVRIQFYILRRCVGKKIQNYTQTNFKGNCLTHCPMKFNMDSLTVDYLNVL